MKPCPLVHVMCSYLQLVSAGLDIKTPYEKKNGRLKKYRTDEAERDNGMDATFGNEKY